MKFACPHCQQHLEADDSFAGTTVDCPTCGKPFVVEEAHIIKPPAPPVPDSTPPPPDSEPVPEGPETASKSREGSRSSAALQPSAETEPNAEKETIATPEPESMPPPLSETPKASMTVPPEMKAKLIAWVAIAKTKAFAFCAWSKEKVTATWKSGRKGKAICIASSIMILFVMMKCCGGAAGKTTQTSGVGANAMGKKKQDVLLANAKTISDNATRNIVESESGKFLGAVLGIIAQGKGGKKLAKRLGSELSGQAPAVIREKLRKDGYEDVVRSVMNMSAKNLQFVADSGYQYIDKVKHWQAATVELWASPMFMNVTAGYRHNREPKDANLKNKELIAILETVGINPNGATLNRDQRAFLEHAKCFNLANPEERKSFAESLVTGGLALKDRNLALQEGMSPDEVFKHIKNVKKFLTNR